MKMIDRYDKMTAEISGKQRALAVAELATLFQEQSATERRIQELQSQREEDRREREGVGTNEDQQAARDEQRGGAVGCASVRAEHEADEILDRLRYNVAKEAEFNPAGGAAADRHLEIRVLREFGVHFEAGLQHRKLVRRLALVHQLRVHVLVLQQPLRRGEAVAFERDVREAVRNGRE